MDSMWIDQEQGYQHPDPGQEGETLPHMEQTSQIINQQITELMKDNQKASQEKQRESVQETADEISQA
jgi:hypothetical protein